MTLGVVATEMVIVERDEASDPVLRVGGMRNVAGSLEDLHSRRRYQLREFGDHSRKQSGLSVPCVSSSGTLVVANAAVSTDSAV